MAEAPAPPSRNILLTTAERMINSVHNYWLVLISDVAGAVGFLIPSSLRLHECCGRVRDRWVDTPSCITCSIVEAYSSRAWQDSNGSIASTTIETS